MQASYKPSFLTTSLGKSSSPTLNVCGSSIFTIARNSSASSSLMSTDVFGNENLLKQLYPCTIRPRKRRFLFFKTTQPFSSGKIDVESYGSSNACFRLNWCTMHFPVFFQTACSKPVHRPMEVWSL